MSHDCGKCAFNVPGEEFGVDGGGHDYTVALAGNPNTGKSTVFNALTGLKQHTGNWPGKTVTRAEGSFSINEKRYKLVDLPGTYSLLSASTDEEVARDFILFGQPDCTLVVMDATAIERNLNLALQVLEISQNVVVVVNLLDEAKRKAIEVDLDGLSRELGVPVVGTVARKRKGLGELLKAVEGVIDGSIKVNPKRPEPVESIRELIGEMVEMDTLFRCDASLTMGANDEETYT